MIQTDEPIRKSGRVKKLTNDYRRGIKAVGVVAMPTKEALEQMGPTELAVQCGKVAESPTASSIEADQARDMRQEWALLNVSVTPHPPSLQAQKDYEAKMERLKRKMVGFLSAVQPGHGRGRRYRTR